MLSVPHLVVIFVIALVVFGPQKLPELARTLGKLMAEFRKASGDFRSAFEEEMRDLERQARETERKMKEAARLPAAGETVTPAPTVSSDIVPGASPIPSQDAPQDSAASDDTSSAALIGNTSSPDGVSNEPNRPHDESSFLDSYQEGGQPETQADNGSSNTISKPNHVDRQPA